MAKLWLALFVIVLSSCDRTPKVEKEVFGVVNGRYILGSDIQKKFGLTTSQLEKLSPQEKIKLFESWTPDLLLEYEANHTGLSVENLTGIFEKISPKSISDIEKKNYLEKHPEHRNISPAKLAQLVKEERLKSVNEKYHKELRARSTVKNFLQLQESGQ